MRPLKRCEEAQAPSRGKQSHLRKGTAVVNNPSKVFSEIKDRERNPGFSYVFLLDVGSESFILKMERKPFQLVKKKR
ncbi:hypothetical protein FZC75_00380 [Sutcliffiella horikoshii]|uniref:Uncharacterized protein n=1 Tax=Sutcliffiella horikoshii TaxID=79883 RepID=A0A5D4TIB5_9BACI|nr:hypothetical protein FZC75_00380 [Sutcliffiella horikoshii]